MSCVSLWIGKSLGPIERACLRSVLRQGHRFVLYCYAKPDGVPDGVELRDAAEVIADAEVLRHRSGSVSLFSNRFRYETQRRELGTWLDCDAYLVRPLEETSDYLIGQYEPGRMNGGVLRLPSDSPTLKPLLEIFDEQWVMPWLPWTEKLKARWRLKIHGRIKLSEMPWGVAGPLALTYVFQTHELSKVARPPEAFYPVRWQDADWILDPEATLEDVVSRETISVHFWNERIKRYKNQIPPPGSVLARLHAEGDA